MNFGRVGLYSSAVVISAGSSYVLSGSITGWSSSIGFITCSVGISGPQGIVTMSTNNGQFQWNISSSNAGTYIVRPISINAPSQSKRNGLTSADTTIIQAHNLANPTQSGYALIACDLNSNNTVNAQDTTYCKQIQLNDGSAYTLMVNSWRFIPQNYTFPNKYSPWGFPTSMSIDVSASNYNVDFYGIKVGDPNGSAVGSNMY